MLAPAPHDDDPLQRLSGSYRAYQAYLAATFGDRLSADDRNDVLQGAFADEATRTACPSDANDVQLRAWFKRVLHNDAVDLIRRQSARSRGEDRAGAHATNLSGASTAYEDRDEDGPAPRVLAGHDAEIARLERDDEAASWERTVTSALQRADPATARLLRARLADEKPAVIALREGWNKAKYERKVTAAYKRLHTILASIEEGPHCSSIRELLLGHQDGMLSAESRRSVAVHVETCVHCKAYRRTLRQRIAAFLPWPLPAFLLRALGRSNASDVATASTAGGGGTAAAGLLLAGGGKTAAVVCAAAILGGGCITASAIHQHHLAPHHHATAAATPTAPATAPASTPTPARPATTPTPPPTSSRRHAARAKPGRSAKPRGTAAARRRKAAAASGHSLKSSAYQREFAPQPTSTNHAAPATTTPPATTAPPVAQTATPPAASAPATPPAAPATPPVQKPTAPRSSHWSSEFAP